MDSDDDPGAPAPGRAARDDAAGYEAIEEQLRAVRVRRDGIRTRMRAAVDLFWLIVFAVALTVLVSVTVLAVVAFGQGENGVGMLFSALLLVAVPLVAAATWRAFGPLWGLSQQLAVLRRQEEELYERLATPGTAPAPRRGWRRLRRVQAEKVRDAAVEKGFRKVAPRGGTILWALVAAATVLLMFVVGVAMGQSHRG